jgi:hypothetical protein
MSKEKFKALKKAEEEGSDFDFFAKDAPKCPHCGIEISIEENELYWLYQDGTHEITCPCCGEQFTVEVAVSFTFSTNEQEEDV